MISGIRREYNKSISLLLIKWRKKLVIEIEIVEFPNNSRSNRVIIDLHLSFSHYAMFPLNIKKHKVNCNGVVSKGHKCLLSV